jgi:hypothetical protein
MIERVQWRIREGSVGAEILSVVWILALAIPWLLHPPPEPPSGTLYWLINRTFPRALLLCFVLVGVLHVTTLVEPARFRYLVVRKFCTVVECVPWLVITAELARRGQTGYAVLMAIFIALLGVAICRKQYQTA